MILNLFTLFHVLLSLVGIGAGFIVVYGLLVSKFFDGWSKLFLITTLATSVTGFFFPFHGFKPSHVFGILSLVLLAFAFAALYRFHLAGGWRRTFAITSVIALYLNVFILIVQLFLRVPLLRALAPTQAEPPFKIAHLTALLLFTFLGVRAGMKFHANPNVKAKAAAG